MQRSLVSSIYSYEQWQANLYNSISDHPYFTISQPIFILQLINTMIYVDYWTTQDVTMITGTWNYMNQTSADI